ncbi:MAG: hypothetical protein Q8N99_05700 [Nanoarchaeota archaeon]|nr:hypothetical protein [Nanoarchaeota archaeon]
MVDEIEARYNFIISTDNIDFVSNYLKGLKLEDGRDYHCLRNVGVVTALLTVNQVEGLKEDMKNYIEDILLDFDIEALGMVTPKIRKRLEEFVKS